MSDHLDCSDVRGIIFELMRDELSGLKQRAVAEHLAGCSDCRELAEKTEQMFDAAAGDDPAIWTDTAPDRLFDRIASAIDDDTEVDVAIDEEARLDAMFDAARDGDDFGERTTGADELFGRIRGELEASPDTGQPDRTDRRPDDDASTPEEPASKSPPADRSRHRHQLAIGGAVAAVFALVAGWMLFASDGTAPADDDTSAQETFADSDSPGGDTDGQQRIAFDAMHRVASDLEAIQMFAHATTLFDVDDADATTVELTDGALLVEVRPGADHPFSVRAQSHTITVTGTVFSVEIGESTPGIAVYEGSVEVREPAGTARTLSTGERLTDGQVHAVDEQTRSEVDRTIDLAAHRRLADEAIDEAIATAVDDIDDAVDAADDRQRQRADELAAAADPDEPTVETEPTSPRDLHAQGLEALHGDDPNRAAELLERALDASGPDDDHRATIRLDLARLYLRQLDDPQQAAVHLNAFVEQWPDDPAADAIADQLCDLDVDDIDDAICD